MARVYVETSFISAYVTNRTDVASAYRRDLSVRWWNEQRGHHDLVVSEEVLRELADPDHQNREVALALVDDVAVLQLTADVRELARILVEQRVMPGPAEAGDAVHVALATVDRSDYVITWNVRHLANANKVKHLHGICRRAGYPAPIILTPDVLWEYEE